jgi:cell division protein FtsL
MRRWVWAAVTAVVVMGLLFLFVLPGRTLLDQQRSIDRARQRISAFGQENSKLRGEIKQLQDPSQVEQIAHQQYGLVLPGQQAYTIIPPTATTTTTTLPERR